MGKRGHGGKKKNKKNKSGNENKENALEKKTTPLNDKIILDKGYKGDLRSVTVKHVHHDVTLEDIAKHIEYTDGKQYKLLAVERLKKKQTAEDDNKSVQFLPSRTCKLTFKGKDIPSKVKLGTAEVECKPFWNYVIQCYNCLRYRHLSTTCKGYARCSKCSSRKDTDHKCATDDLKCANCHGDHDALDNSCPKYTFHKEINLIRAQENIDYKSAVQRHTEEKKVENEKIPIDSESFLSQLDELLSKKIQESLSKKMDELTKKLLSLESKISHVGSKITDVSS